MVPQAAGAGNAKTVSNMLTMSVVWTCVILLVPVVVAYSFFTDIVLVPSSTTDSGFGSSSGQLNCSLGSGHGVESVTNTTKLLLPDCDMKCTVQQYMRVCALYLLPY
eukprot:SAG31_NODE_10545_length_1126_cov_1.355404_1_plen_106_part_01